MEIEFSFFSVKRVDEYLGKFLGLLKKYNLSPEFYEYSEGHKKPFNINGLKKEFIKENIYPDLIKSSKPKYRIFLIDPYKNTKLLGNLSVFIATDKRSAINAFRQYNLFFKETIELVQPIYASFEDSFLINQKHWIKYSKNNNEIEESIGNNMLKDGITDFAFINYFGQPYIKLIGKQKLLSTPCYKTKEEKNGIFLQSRFSITKRTENDTLVENKCIKHIGNEYFWQPPNKKATKFPKINWGEQSKTTKNTDGEIMGKNNKVLEMEIIENADTCIKVAKDIFDIKLDYSESSVIKLEHIIEKYYKGRKKVKDELINTIGSLLGEIMRRNIGGHWGYFNFEGADVVALIDFREKDDVVFPINKVYKRFANGKEDDLAFYYKVLKNEK